MSSKESDRPFLSSSFCFSLRCYHVHLSTAFPYLRILGRTAVLAGCHVYLPVSCSIWQLMPLNSSADHHVFGLRQQMLKGIGWDMDALVSRASSRLGRKQHVNLEQVMSEWVAAGVVYDHSLFWHWVLQDHKVVTALVLCSSPRPAQRRSWGTLSYFAVQALVSHSLMYW